MCQTLCYVLLILCWTDKAGCLSLMLSGVACNLIGEISHKLGHRTVNNRCKFLFSLNLGRDKSSNACLVNAQDDQTSVSDKWLSLGR